MSLRHEPEAFCGNLDEVVINSLMKENIYSHGKSLRMSIGRMQDSNHLI